MKIKEFFKYFFSTMAVILIFGFIIYFVFVYELFPSAPSAPRHQLVEKNNWSGMNPADTFTVVGEGTPIGQLKTVNLLRDRDKNPFSAITFIPLKKGQKVLLDNYIFYVSDPAQQSRCLQVREVLDKDSSAGLEIKINNLRGIMSNGDTLVFDRFGE